MKIGYPFFNYLSRLAVYTSIAIAMKVCIYLLVAGSHQIEVDLEFLFFPLLLGAGVWVLKMLTGELPEQVKSEALNDERG